ncbi:hypothetical protein ACTL6U_03835 [Rhodovibrionaceae bacterium A322]
MGDSDPTAQGKTQSRDEDSLWETLDVASKQTLPLELGSIELTEEGLIQHRESSEPVTFSFKYHNYSFAGELAEHHNGRLRLVGDLGKLPYTAESPEGRNFIRKLSAATSVMPHGKFIITDRQDVRLLAEEELPEPHTPVSFMATAAALLLEFKPFLDLANDFFMNTKHLQGPESATS